MGGRKPFLFVIFATLLLAIAVLGFVDSHNVNPPSGLARLIGLYQPGTHALADHLKPAPGFEVGLFAEGLGDPRMMAITTAGDILVSAPDRGAILRVAADRDGDGASDGVATLVDGLSGPHGIALAGDTLFIAEEGAVSRIGFDATSGETRGEREVILSGLPSDGGHSTRTIHMGPDGHLYVTIGSSCNVCIEDSPWRAAMLRFAPDGSNVEVFATGLRNTVGFGWDPATSELFGVDNGRDLLGDGYPPDELNRIVEGGFYGWPFYNGENETDPDFGDADERIGLVPEPPVYKFAAHMAPLSIRFLQHQPDPTWNGAALISHHGSWNRATRVGYHVVSLHRHDRDTYEVRMFLDGFRDDQEVFGRPVDVVEAQDGTIYVSDDFAGTIWRLVPKMPAISRSYPIIAPAAVGPRTRN